MLLEETAGIAFVIPAHAGGGLPQGKGAGNHELLHAVQLHPCLLYTSGPIRAYIDMIQQKVARDHIHVTIYDNPTQGHLPDELLERAVALWDEAEALADNGQVLWRVQKSRMQVRYTQIHRMPLDAPDRERCV